ncbi:MAG: PhoH family protein [Candidatus Eisenbacteria sp.]|nr:PhoH family protein [Candidatus Eisenbacteria bacterium]
MAKELVREWISLGEMEPLALLGAGDRNLKVLREDLGVKIVARGDRILLEGPAGEMKKAKRLLTGLVAEVRAGRILTPGDVRSAIRAVQEGKAVRDVADGSMDLECPRKIVRAKTTGQRNYIRCMMDHDVVFSIGPAGTGKTYLAMAAAVSALKHHLVDRILLVRPAVEAGESLGFLPGDLLEKIDPYLRPLYDALYGMMAANQIRRSLDMGVIEVAPLAYMRGRTIDNAFVLLDEAQNTTLGQLKMFLTRLGFNSRAVITGDVTQIDLVPKGSSGLILIQPILSEIADIAWVHMTEKDVVRHPMVQKIIKAFEKYSDESED